MTIKRVCICGGGGLGHTCTAVLSNHAHVEVDMYTHHPEQWNRQICVHTPDNNMLIGHLAHITDKPEYVIHNADVVLLCLPAFLVEQTLKEIQPFLRKETVVGAIVGNSGFFLYAHQILPNNAPLFAFQRVPYISRVIDYGKEAALLGYKDELLMAVENVENDSFCAEIAALFQTPTRLVDSFYEVTLSNSNPILHTGRLYTLWKDWDGISPYAVNPLFYHDWTDEASAIEIAMDKEFFRLLEALQVPMVHIETLLTHYEATDAASLTAKLRSIPSFANIYSPMTQVADGWLPDFTSRYFTEDFPYGLRFIYELAHQHNLSTPTIDIVYNWGMNYINNSNYYERLTC